jgi:hypothetical protein
LVLLLFISCIVCHRLTPSNSFSCDRIDHASVKLVSDNIITPPVREDDYFYRSEVVIGRERHEARSKELKAMGVNVGKVSLPYIAVSFFSERNERKKAMTD